MRHVSEPWDRKIPWRREWLPIPLLWPGKYHEQRSLAGYSPWGPKESDTTKQLTLSLWMSNHRAKGGIQSRPLTTSETWAVRSPSPGPEAWDKEEGQRVPVSCVICPQVRTPVSFLQNNIQHSEFLLQSGPQRWLGEPGLACPGSTFGVSAAVRSPAMVRWAWISLPRFNIRSFCCSPVPSDG